MTDAPTPQPVPRGRHAPPLEVRLDRQRRRLYTAAAVVFARSGYADATAESISRQAGMSKATFYEHFANKEQCIVALFDAAAIGIARDIRQVADQPYPSHTERVHAGATAFVAELTRQPALAQTLIVEIIGAGPRAMERRDATLQGYADWLYADNARVAHDYGAPTFATPDDAYAVIGAIFELVSRQMRTGSPAAASDLVPVIERVLVGTLGAARE